MGRFRATRLADGETVTYSGDAPQAAHLGDDWRLEEIFEPPVVEEGPPVAPTVYGGRRWLTRLEFVALLSQEEYLGILAAARTNVAVEAWLRMLEWASADADGCCIDLDDVRLGTGMQALVELGLLTPERAAEVLRG